MTHLNRNPILRFFIEKCVSLLLDGHCDESTGYVVAERIKKLDIKDIKLPNDEIYRWLDKCAHETKEHISYIIFDMMGYYKSFGGEPNKDIHIFVNEYMELLYREKNEWIFDKYEKRLDNIIDNWNGVMMGWDND